MEIVRQGGPIRPPRKLSLSRFPLGEHVQVEVPFNRVPPSPELHLVQQALCRRVPTFILIILQSLVAKLIPKDQQKNRGHLQSGGPRMQMGLCLSVLLVSAHLCQQLHRRLAHRGVLIILPNTIHCHILRCRTRRP